MNLNQAPSVVTAHIGVAVNGGAISLSGEAGTYPEKRSAEQAALGVHGGIAVADDRGAEHLEQAGTSSQPISVKDQS